MTNIDEKIDRNYFNKRLFNKFIRLIKTDDTPSLIQHIADNRNYLVFCSLIFKIKQSGNLQILQFGQIVNEEIRKQSITYDKIKNKLIPVALALGLNIDCSDAFQKDYYQILGVRPDATPPEIKTAYRKKAGIVHPDKPTGKKDDFIAIQEAYSVLGDDSIRHQYDISCKQAPGPVWSEAAFPASGLQEKSGRVSRYAYYLIVLVLCLLCISFITDMVYQEFSLDDHVETANNRNVDRFSKFNHEISLNPIVQTAGQPGSNKRNARINFSKESEKRIAALESKYYNKYNGAKVSGSGKEINNRKIKVQKKIGGSVQQEKSSMISSGLKNVEKYSAPSDSSRQTDAKPNKFGAQHSVNQSERLNDFIGQYCRTYESKNINEFMKFFTKNAIENGKPIKSLLSEYQHNFQMLDKIDFQIHIKNYLFDLDLNKVRMEGAFNLKWRKKNEDIWKKYQGNIQMDLINDEKQAFLVDRLDYRFKD